MFFFKLKMSMTVDAVVIMTLFIATRVMAAYDINYYLTVGIVFVALIVETMLSMMRAFDLKAVTFLWCVQRNEVDRLQKEVNHLQKITREDSDWG